MIVSTIRTYYVLIKMINPKEYFNDVTKVFKSLDTQGNGYILSSKLDDLWYYSGINGKQLFPKILTEMGLQENNTAKVVLPDLLKYLESKLIQPQ